MRFILILIAGLIAVNGVQAMAQDDAQPSAAQDQDGGDLRPAVQNPISSLISLPFKFTFDYGAPDGEASFLNIQPVVPITVGNWNLVNRAIIPLIHTTGEVAGTPGIPNPIKGNGATGLGDINYSLFFHRSNTTRQFGASGRPLPYPPQPTKSSAAKNGAPGRRVWSSSSPNGGPSACSPGIWGHLPAIPIARISTNRCLSLSQTTTSPMAGI